MTLPSNASERKALPITTGVLDYFPDALAAVAEVSKKGNDQHNPGQPLHWSKDKSTDHADCIVRHLIDRGTLDTDGGRHSAKVAWRALALLQIEIENERAAEFVERPATAFHPFPSEALEAAARATGSEVVHEADCPACAAGLRRGDPGPDFPAWH